jgi:hypothetical protein
MQNYFLDVACINIFLCISGSSVVYYRRCMGDQYENEDENENENDNDLYNGLDLIVLRNHFAAK